MNHFTTVYSRYRRGIRLNVKDNTMFVRHNKMSEPIVNGFENLRILAANVPACLDAINNFRDAGEEEIKETLENALKTYNWCSHFDATGNLVIDYVDYDGEFDELVATIYPYMQDGGTIWGETDDHEPWQYTFREGEFPLLEWGWVVYASKLFDKVTNPTIRAMLKDVLENGDAALGPLCDYLQDVLVPKHKEGK